MPKTLVLYVFHEYNERVRHFIENCIFESTDVEFMIIVNNANLSPDSIDGVPPYVKTLFRENLGYDFGGWSDALLTDSIYNNYDNFIFVNSSVIGPFLPSYFTGKWTDVYINGLQGNTKLFGSTINTICEPAKQTHVQSYIFSMGKETRKH